MACYMAGSLCVTWWPEKWKCFYDEWHFIFETFFFKVLGMCPLRFNLIQLFGSRRCETPPSPPAPDPVGIENCNSTLRYECNETFSDECEFTARAKGEWCNHTCQENVCSHEYRTKFYITRCENADFRTRGVRKTAFTHSEWYKQLFSPLLAFTTQKKATHNTDIISAVCVTFCFWVVNARRNEKSWVRETCMGEREIELTLQSWISLPRLILRKKDQSVVLQYCKTENYFLGFSLKD